MYLRQGHMPPRLLALSDSTEGYRSGHNEAVLKNYRSDHSKLPKTLDFIGFFALFLALCEMSISQFSRNFLNFIFRYLLTFRSV